MAHSFFIQNLIDSLKTIVVYKNHVNHFFRKGIDSPKGIVSMIDGSIHHGGLSDRLCGIISSYKYSLEKEIPFHLYYIYPYRLEDYLLPNLIDWTIRDEQISYSLFDSQSIFVSLHRHNPEKQRPYTNFRIRRAKGLQTHIYSNMYYFSNGKEFGQLFRDLFKPSEKLLESIDANIKAIGEDYISVTFRFQQLLGDFKETGFKTLASDEEKDKLIARCEKCIEYLHSIDNRKILVTSDSRSFLDIVQNKYNYIYTIPGQLVHMDFVDKQDKISYSVHLKSFIDLFVLANAKQIYLANIYPLYKSSFPLIASWIYNKDSFIMEENTYGSFTIDKLEDKILVDNML